MKHIVSKVIACIIAASAVALFAMSVKDAVIVLSHIPAIAQGAIDFSLSNPMLGYIFTGWFALLVIVIYVTGKIEEIIGGDE